ncbi:unnamed protein product [Paramecium primaurelia]|uniref:Cyclic nucleotide-binding domain-containing protein n=1 Tax=Paramecium primaurelia TaxID=5886 RepID=A0A8S1P0L2_PARPR|nr:unnamed protein product [Paramecium primaurelia]
MDNQIEQKSLYKTKFNHSTRNIFQQKKFTKQQFFRSSSQNYSHERLEVLETNKEEERDQFVSQPINSCFERVLDRKHSIQSNLGSIKELSVSDQLADPTQQQDINNENAEQNTQQNTHSVSGAPQNTLRNRRKLKRLPRLNEEREPPKLQNDFSLIIMPNNKYKQYWDVVLFLILIYVSIFTPFKIGFVQDGEYLTWDYLDNAIDFIFMTDIILTFLSAAYDDEGNLITERKAIILNYLKGWFIIDLMSSIPFYFILNDTSQRYNSIARISKVPKIYRVVKMIKLARMFRLKEIQYVKVININIGNERFILAFLLLIFSCHVVGCIWFFVATLSEEEDWIYFESHTFDQYIISMYWAVQTVLTVGYGDIKFYSWSTRIFAIVWMLSSVYVFSFAVGSLASFLDRLDQNNQIYLNRLATLKNIKQEFKISKKMFLKVKRELKHGKRDFSQQYHILLEELPLILKTELSYIMNKHLKEEIGYFHDKSQQFISAIGPLLKPIKLEANEFVYCTGDLAEEIYFVKSGKLAIVLPDQQNFKFMMIKPGSYFGELDILFYGEKRKYTIMTTKPSEFYLLSRKDFKSIYLHQFRDEGQILVNEALQRKVMIKSAYDDALCFLGEDKNQQHPRVTSHKASKFKVVDNATSPQVDPKLVIQQKTEDYSNNDDGLINFDKIQFKKKISALEKQIKIKDQIIANIQQELDELMNQIQHQISDDIIGRFKITKSMEEMMQLRRQLKATNKMEETIKSQRQIYRSVHQTKQFQIDCRKYSSSVEQAKLLNSLWEE